jgi:hypothetical protein
MMALAEQTKSARSSSVDQELTERPTRRNRGGDNADRDGRGQGNIDVEWEEVDGIPRWPQRARRRRKRTEGGQAE